MVEHRTVASSGPAERIRTPVDDAEVLACFPRLRAIAAGARRRLLGNLRVATLPADTVVFHDGAECRDYLLVLEGTVRVEKISADGHEIVLYRVGPGESCVLTTSCLLAGERYPARAVTESPVRAALMPAARFRELVSSEEAFRTFVFEAYGRRIADLIGLVREVSFEPLDARLARRLLARSTDGAEIRVTHQGLAAELGTAREVISRRLHEFAAHGWVEPGRGRIVVRDRAALARLAHESGG